MAAAPAIAASYRQALWLTLLAACLAVWGAPWFAAALFASPVAVHWVREDRRGGLLLMGLAVCVVGGVTGSAAWGSAALVVVLLGAMLGLLIRAGLGYGLCVSAMAAAGSLVAGAYLAVNGSEVHRLCTIWLNARKAELEAAGEVDSPVLGMAETFSRINENLANLGFGLVFGLIVLLAVLLVVSVSRRLRLEGLRTPGRFRDMRAPDWLVWLAIATALLWLADQHWQQPWMRLVSWNAAQGLEMVYGINGVSIAVYAVGVLTKGPPRFQAALVVLVVALFRPAIAFFGLFDTWLDFRRKADQLAEARRARQSDRDGES